RGTRQAKRVAARFCRRSRAQCQVSRDDLVAGDAVPACVGSARSDTSREVETASRRAAAGPGSARLPTSARSCRALAQTVHAARSQVACQRYLRWQPALLALEE